MEQLLHLNNEFVFTNGYLDGCFKNIFGKVKLLLRNFIHPLYLQITTTIRYILQLVKSKDEIWSTDMPHCRCIFKIRNITNLFMLRWNVVFKLVLISISLSTIWIRADMIIFPWMCFHVWPQVKIPGECLQISYLNSVGLHLKDIDIDKHTNK